MGNRADYPLVTREEQIFQVLSKELKIQKNRGNELSFKGKIYRGISRFLGEFDEQRVSEENFQKGTGELSHAFPAIGHIQGTISYAIKDEGFGKQLLDKSSYIIPLTGSAVNGFLTGGVSGAFAEHNFHEPLNCLADIRKDHRTYSDVALITNLTNWHYDSNQLFDFKARINTNQLLSFFRLIGQNKVNEKLTEKEINLAIEEGLKKFHPSATTAIYQLHQIEPVIKSIGEKRLKTVEKCRKIPTQNFAQTPKFQAQGKMKICGRNVLVTKLQRDWYEQVKKQNETSYIVEGRKYNINRAGSQSSRLVSNYLNELKQIVTEAKRKFLNLQKTMNSKAFQSSAQKIGEGFAEDFEKIKKEEFMIYPVDKISNFFDILQGHTSTEAKSLQMFTKYVKNMETIDIDRWKHYRIHKDLHFIIGKGSNMGVTIAQYAPKLFLEHYFRKINPNHQTKVTDPVEKCPSQKELANTIRHYGQKEQVVLDLKNTLQSLLKKSISVGNLSMKNIKVSFEARINSLNKIDLKIVLRYWNPHSKCFKDIPMVSKLTNEYKLFEYSSDTDGKDHLQIGAFVDLLGFTEDGLQTKIMVRNISIQIEYGHLQFFLQQLEMDNDQDYLEINVQGRRLHRSIDDVVHLFHDNDIFELGEEEYQKIVITFRAKDQGWGNLKGRLYLRASLSEDKYFDINISNGIVPHEWQQYRFESEIVQTLPPNSVIEFMCVVGGGGGHQLFVDNFNARLFYRQEEAFRKPIKQSKMKADLCFHPLKQVKIVKARAEPLIFNEIIQCGNYYIEGLDVSFQSMSSSDVSKAKIIMRIINKKAFKDIVLQEKVETVWELTQRKINKIITPNSRIQFRCELLNQEEVYVRNFKVNIHRGKLSYGVENFVYEKKQQTLNLLKAQQKTQLLEGRILLESQIRTIKVQYIAKGVGEIFLRIYKQSSEETIDLNISRGITCPEAKEYTFYSPTIAYFTNQGDKIQFLYISENGMIVQNFNYQITYTDETVILNKKYFHSGEGSDELLPLYEQKIYCGLNKVKKIRISFDSRDQGWGNMKGQVFLAILKPTGQKRIISITNGFVPHEKKRYIFESTQIGQDIPPGSQLQMLHTVGGGGGHELFVNKFCAEVVFGNSPRDQSIQISPKQWKQIQAPLYSKLSQIYCEILPTAEMTEGVTLQSITADGKLRDEFPLFKDHASTINKIEKFEVRGEILQRKFAIGDKIRVIKKGDQEESNFQSFKLTFKYFPLQMTQHRISTYEFTNAHWTEKDGLQAINIVGKDHKVRLAQRPIGCAVSCIWRDNQNKQSTGKLFLVREREGEVQNREDIFGTASHQWSNAFTRFDSKRKIICDAQREDDFYIQRQIGENGELFVDNLEMIMICDEDEE